MIRWSFLNYWGTLKLVLPDDFCAKISDLDHLQTISHVIIFRCFFPMIDHNASAHYTFAIVEKNIGKLCGGGLNHSFTVLGYNNLVLSCRYVRPKIRCAVGNAPADICVRQYTQRRSNNKLVCSGVLTNVWSNFKSKFYELTSCCECFRPTHTLYSVNCKIDLAPGAAYTERKWSPVESTIFLAFFFTLTLLYK